MSSMQSAMVFCFLGRDLNKTKTQQNQVTIFNVNLSFLRKLVVFCLLFRSVDLVFD